MGAISALLKSAFAWTTFLYFWCVFVSVAMFMINLAELRAVNTMLPIIGSIFPFCLDFPSDQSKIARKFLGTGLDETTASLVINVLLLGFFAIPHSIFARPGVKSFFGETETLSKKNGTSLYRSLYVLQSSFALHALLAFWQPLDIAPLWNLLPDDASLLRTLLVLTPYLFGVVWTVVALFAIDHFELFGLRQATGKDVSASFGLPSIRGKTIVTRWNYNLVRHPIMTGFFILFSCVPVMTVNHVFFSVACAAYILLAVTFLEEPDLRRANPKGYETYAKKVPDAYCPFHWCFAKKKGAKRE